MTLKQLKKKLGLSDERATLLSLESFNFAGVVFWFKALNPLDFIDSKTQAFVPYRAGTDIQADMIAQNKAKEIKAEDTEAIRKMQEDLRSVQTKIFMKAILYPALSEKEEEGKVFVDDLFAHPQECNDLWMAIMLNSVKKKTPFMYRLTKLWRWIFSPSGMGSSPLKSLG